MGNGAITLKQAAAWCGGRVAPAWENLSFEGANFDTRRLREGELFAAITGARDGHTFAPAAMEKGAAAVLASKPLPETVPAIYTDNTLRALQDIARGYRRTLQARCIGITGSVGKTTTKEMIAAVLEETFRTEKTAANFNNDMGLPVTVLGIDRDCEAMVLEMGMNHRGEISLLTSIAQPDIAVITNVGTMHIENLGSREGILRAKLEILEGLKPGGTAVFNGDDDMLSSVTPDCPVVRFGFGENCTVRCLSWEEGEKGVRFRALLPTGEVQVQLPVSGKHHVTDALAALAVGSLLGVEPETMARALSRFCNTGMRQKIYEKKGVRIIEDCYNAGPESMEAALEVLGSHPGRKIAVLGGMLELGDFGPAAHEAVGRKAAGQADLILCYGANSPSYVQGAREAGCTDARCFDTHEALAGELEKILQPGDTLLVKGSRGMRMEQVLRLLFG